MATATAPGYQDLFDLGRAQAGLAQPDLSFNEGDISEMLVAGIAAMADHVAAYAANRFQATTVDGAQGDDLKAYADDRWQIEAEDATPAQGSITLSRSTANGAPAGTLVAGTVVATNLDSQGVDVEFTLDADQAYTLGDVATRTVSVTAVVAGPAGNVAPGAIARFTATPFDSSFSVTNAANFAGGAQAQSDPSLREQVRQFPSTLRRATLDSLEYGAKTVAGVTVALASEELVGGEPTGIVNLYVSDADGNSTTEMVADVEAILPTWRAAGALVNVLGAEAQSVAIAVTVTLAAGLPTATKTALVPLIQAAIVAQVNTLQGGQGFWHLAVAAAARAVNPLIIENVVVTAPSADPYVPSQPYYTLRITAANVTVSVS